MILSDFIDKNFVVNTKTHLTRCNLFIPKAENGVTKS